MDLNSINLTAAASRGADCQLEHPVTGEALFHEGKPVTVRVVGNDSREFKAALSRISAKLGSKKKSTLEQAEARSVELIAACVKGWYGLYEGKEPIECNPDNVVRVLTEQSWIREQLDTFIADRANFFTNAPKG
jgi:hypothetical protein